MQAFYRHFGVPEAGQAAAERITTPEERALLPLLPAEGLTAEAAAPLLCKAGFAAATPQQAEKALRGMYQRGVLDLAGEDPPVYKPAGFFTRLDVFSVTQPEEYRALPEETRQALEALSLQRYVKGLDMTAPVPTEDEVIPLDELIARVEADDRPLYLSACDCRALAGHKGPIDASFDTCLSYRTVPGSYASRGVSRRVSKAEAVAVLRRADEAGLIHTANPYGGICNCCPCCCYLFRAQREVGSQGRWPIVRRQVQLDESACILCGKCTRRCPFGLFALQNGQLQLNQNPCVGCGLCVNTCPTKALRLAPLPAPQGDAHGQ